MDIKITYFDGFRPQEIASGIIIVMHPEGYVIITDDVPWYLSTCNCFNVYSVYCIHFIFKIDIYKVSGRGKGVNSNSLLENYVLSYDVSFMAIHKNICSIVMFLFCHRTWNTRRTWHAGKLRKNQSLGRWYSDELN